MVFGFLLGLVFLHCFIVGGIFSLTAIGAPLLAKGICAGSIDGYLGFGPKMVINNYMCTKACPCPPSAQATYSKVNVTTFYDFNRTQAAGSNYDANGYLKMFYQGDAAQPRFQTFSDCWETRLSKDNSTFNADQVQQMNAFLKVTAMMESEFACSGVCQPNLFWFTRPVTNIPPTVPCLKTMTDIVSAKFTMAGVCLLIGSIFLLIVWFWQYCLWCKQFRDD